MEEGDNLLVKGTKRVQKATRVLGMMLFERRQADDGAVVSTETLKSL
jgi:hypothetical protein